MIEFFCPHCRACISEDDESVGADLPCPDCEEPLTVPLESDPEAVAFAPEDDEAEEPLSLEDMSAAAVLLRKARAHGHDELVEALLSFGPDEWRGYLEVDTAAEVEPESDAVVTMLLDLVEKLQTDPAQQLALRWEAMSDPDGFKKRIGKALGGVIDTPPEEG